MNEENEATKNKILEMDNSLLKRYLKYREDEGLFIFGKRALGALGTRKKTDTISTYNKDTEFMREYLKEMEKEDDETHQLIDNMTIITLQDMIKKRKKWTVFENTKRLEGKLHTRKRFNTGKNYFKDTKYMVERLKALEDKEIIQVQDKIISKLSQKSKKCVCKCPERKTTSSRILNNSNKTKSNNKRSKK
jgi:hypothetical protein